MTRGIWKLSTVFLVVPRFWVKLNKPGGGVASFSIARHGLRCGGGAVGIPQSPGPQQTAPTRQGSSSPLKIRQPKRRFPPKVASRSSDEPVSFVHGSTPFSVFSASD